MGTDSSTALSIVVIGAGLGGLSAALCLAQKGHQVQVFEAQSELSELGAGIQVPPNAARVLDRLGLLPKIKETAAEPAQETFRRYSDGSAIGFLRRNLETLFGYPSMVIHRGDFQRVLYDAAVDAGVTFAFGKKIASSDIQGDASTSELANADVIVAADGISSAVRTGLVGSDEKYKPALTGETAGRIVLEREKIESDPTLKWLVEPTNNVWMGPERHAVAYSIRNSELLNVVLCGPGEAPIGKYNEPVEPAVLSEDYSDFEPVVRGIIAKADKAHRWCISETPILPRWTDGRVVLLGDSAHSMMPYAAQGAAQAVEDAMVLGVCLGKIGSKQEIAGRLKRYEQLRKPRAERVQEVARGNRLLFGLKDGPEQRARDARLSQIGGQAQGLKKRPEPDAQAPYGSPAFTEWLFGADVETEATAALALGRCVSGFDVLMNETTTKVQA